jgi:hypothetical protein
VTVWWKRLRYTLALVGLCAIATCPVAKRSCTAKERSREAEQLLGYLGDRVAEVVAATGKLPPLAAGPSPTPDCCEQGGTCDPDAKTWDTPGWHALGFTIDSPYRYSYEYAPDPGGEKAVLRAVGDLECNGQSSRYQLELHVQGATVERTWTRKDPSE